MRKCSCRRLPGQQTVPEGVMMRRPQGWSRVRTNGLWQAGLLRPFKAQDLPRSLQVTLLLLPCSVTNDEAVVRAAVGAAEQRRYKVGLHQLRFGLEALQGFAAGGCAKRLWRARATHVRRGVRHGWCVHQVPFTHKFNFQWSVGHPPAIQYNMGTESQGAVRTLAFWVSNINFAELLGMCRVFGMIAVACWCARARACSFRNSVGLRARGAMCRSSMCAGMRLPRGERKGAGLFLSLCRNHSNPLFPRLPFSHGTAVRIKQYSQQPKPSPLLSVAALTLCPAARECRRPLRRKTGEGAQRHDHRPRHKQKDDVGGNSVLNTFCVNVLHMPCFWVL